MPTDLITGAFSYTGRYIAQRLLASGRRLRTLTGHPEKRDRLGAEVEVAPLDFSDRAGLVRAFQGIDTFYNTYWVRFPRAGVTFEDAEENSRILFDAAAHAGVRRIVHISITNPSPDSPFPYFAGKARVEEALGRCGVSSGIVRPTVVFGREDVLINNIAWLLRRIPVFGIPGDGSYRVRPVFVDDVARLCVESAEGDEDLVVDAVGPETFTFEELIRAIASAVGRKVRIVHVPPAAALAATRLLNLVVSDVMLTRDEMNGLMAELVVTDSPATGEVALTEWMRRHSGELGQSYASELERHYRDPEVSRG